MREELLTAILTGTEWTDRFNRYEYRKAIQEYAEKFAPMYAAVLQQEGADLTALAGEILDELEAATAKQRFWNRSVYKANIKLTIVEFLSPMLMDLGGEGTRLAETLRDGWNGRYPKDPYQIASREKLQKGFRHVILGIEIPEKRRHEDED